VVLLECGDDVVGLVPEVVDEGALLEQMDAIEP